MRSLRERGIKVGVLSNTMWPRSAHERVFLRDQVLDLIDGAVNNRFEYGRAVRRQRVNFGLLLRRFERWAGPRDLLLT